jgi:hypothetical protein
MACTIVVRMPLQYVLAADAGSAPTEDTIFRLPADYALKEADVFRKWAEVYAKDAGAFTRDFQRTYQRAMQVGRTAEPGSLHLDGNHTQQNDTCTRHGTWSTCAMPCFSCAMHSCGLLKGHDRLPCWVHLLLCQQQHRNLISSETRKT